MVRFLRKWLVPLLAVLLLIGVATAFVPLSQQMEARAETELTLLMDRAFARIEAGDRLAKPMIAAEQENLLSKAVAISRFLTHDDTLLASDALVALCEQLAVDRIDVADIEGTLIASSDAARIGTALGTQEVFAWTMAAAKDKSAAVAQQDSADPSMLYACVGRSDIEGFVLLSRNDPHIASALMLSDAESITSDIAYGGDVIFAAETGADGFFYESGSLCLRRTLGDTTLIAARPTTEVYAVRSAAILAFGAALVCAMICGVAAYLIRLEPVSAEEDEDLALDAVDEAAASQPELMENEEAASDHTQARKRLFQKQERQRPEPPELTEAEQQHEKAVEHAPRQIARAKKRTHDSASQQTQEDSESAFEKIVE